MRFINNKKAFTMLGMVCLMAASPAFAQGDVGELADRLRGFMGNFADLLTATMFLVGIGLGAMAALKLKAHNEDPRQVKITVPIVYALASAMLIGLPAWLTLTKNSLVDGQANSIDDSVYSTIE